MRIYRFTLDELAPNAFIEALKLDDARRSLTFRAIEEYGKRALAALEAAGDRGRMVMNRDQTRNFLREYADCFSVSADSSRLMVADGKTKHDLIQRFRGCLPLGLLKVFCDPDVVKGMPDTYADN